MYLTIRKKYNIFVLTDTDMIPLLMIRACEVFSVNLPFCGKKVCFQGRAFKSCSNYNIS